MDILIIFSKFGERLMGVQCNSGIAWNSKIKNKLTYLYFFEQK